MTIIKKVKNFLRTIYCLEEQIAYFLNIDSMIESYKPFLLVDEVHDYLSELRNLLTVKNVQGGRYVRIGKHNDGGYVMLDEICNICAAYSIGINSDVSWDSDINRRTGCNVYMYDHTIDKLPYHQKGFHWKKIGVCGEAERGKAVDLLTLNEMLVSNHHKEERNLVLKMDVEGAEWDVLSTVQLSVIEQFDQIILELHDLLDFNQRENVINGLIKLNKTHQIVHIHGSNGSFYIPFQDVNIPNVMEVCFVRKKGRCFVKSERFFPTILDENNNGILPDMIIGFWNEKNSH